jgi:hypothetical protein
MASTSPWAVDRGRALRYRTTFSELCQQSNDGQPVDEAAVKRYKLKVRGYYGWYSRRVGAWTRMRLALLQRRSTVPLV